MKSRKNIYYLSVLISLITFLAYLSALRNGFVEWDDDVYIVENLHIRSLGIPFLKWAFFDFYSANWHPLTWISHALDYAIWGLNPFGHHLMNIIFHAVNTFIVVLLMMRLLQARNEQATSNRASHCLGERTMLIAAGATGLLFGLHPLHVESVAWVSERKDLLCAFFFLLSIIMYIRHVHVRENQAAQENMKSFGFRKYYFLSCGFYALALLSKPMAVTLPVVLLILDWYPFERIQSFQAFRHVLTEKIFFLALSLFSSIMTILAQRAEGAIRSTALIPLLTRVMVGAKSLIAYLWKILWPSHLLPYYPNPGRLSILSFGYLSAIALVIAISAVCIVLAKKEKLWLTVWGIYVVTLLPVLGIIQVGDQAMADRYMYLPSLGPFLLVGLAVAMADRTITNGGIIAKLFSNVTVVVAIVLLLLLTSNQIGIWANGHTLWSYVIDKDPGTSPLSYINLGAADTKAGQFAEAIESFDKAISMNPSTYVAYKDRGIAYKMVGQFDRAIEDLSKAIALKPVSHEAYLERGLVYFKMSQFEKAIDDYNQAISLNPGYDQAYFNRGVVYERVGRFDQARMDYNTTIALNPSSLEAYNNLGVLYGNAGFFDQAIYYFNKATLVDQRQPRAYLNRGIIFAKSGNKAQAIVDFQMACNLGSTDACNALQATVKMPTSH